MIRKKMWNVAVSAASVLAAGMLVLSSPISALAATGTITSSNVKVRAEASTSSSQVSSLDSGDKVDIIDETKDSQGYVWYRIYINDSEFGYVRSDLVSKQGATKSTDAGTASSSLPETQVTAVDEQPATVTVASANVRSGAGTGYSSVGTVKNGEGVTITGEATGTDDKKWYQIKFGSSGRTGFVRGDLLQAGAAPAAPAEGEAAPAEGEAAPAEGGEAAPAEGEAAPAEGEAAPAEGEATPAEEQAAPAVVGDGEFSLDYKADENGNSVWYLLDNFERNQVKLNDLFDYAKEGQQAKALEVQVKRQKTFIIGMAIAIAILVLGVLFLIYRLRDYMYYEDEEEETTATKKNKYEELPEQKPAKKLFGKGDSEAKSQGRTVADSKRNTAPAKNSTASSSRRAPIGSAASLLPDEKPASRKITPEKGAERPTPSRERAAAQRASANAAAAGRKSRNFLLDDQDFEFEFLDLDDDDK